MAPLDERANAEVMAQPHERRYGKAREGIDGAAHAHMARAGRHPAALHPHGAYAGDAAADIAFLQGCNRCEMDFTSSGASWETTGSGRGHAVARQAGSNDCRRRRGSSSRASVVTWKETEPNPRHARSTRYGQRAGRQDAREPDACGRHVVRLLLLRQACAWRRARGGVQPPGDGGIHDRDRRDLREDHAPRVGPVRKDRKPPRSRRRSHPAAKPRTGHPTAPRAGR